MEMSNLKNESPAQKKKRASEIVKLLKRKFPDDPGTELHYKTPLDLLVATILSAQATDKRVNMVTERLFKKYRTAADYAHAKQEEFEAEIRETGFYRNKAKSVIGMAQALLTKHGGEVPRTMEELVGLPGVGRKTANLILGIVFGEPGIVCDTHVIRVSQRLGLTGNKDPEKIERDLTALIPDKEWTGFSSRLIVLGRYTCTARHPAHHDCPLVKACPSATLI